MLLSNAKQGPEEEKKFKSVPNPQNKTLYTAHTFSTQMPRENAIT